MKTEYQCVICDKPVVWAGYSVRLSTDLYEHVYSAATCKARLHKGDITETKEDKPNE